MFSLKISIQNGPIILTLSADDIIIYTDIGYWKNLPKVCIILYHQCFAQTTAYAHVFVKSKPEFVAVPHSNKEMDSRMFRFSMFCEFHTLFTKRNLIIRR